MIWWARSAAVLIGALLVLGVSGCATQGGSSATMVSTAREGYLPVDQLQIVDCLLPGQIRKLGNMVYKTQRRPTRTTAANCEIRGGEYVAYDRADYRTALHVWMPRAQAGAAKAQNYVGEIFEKGLGRAPDYVSAAAWYRRAAKQGYTRAMINLGFLYEKGLGVEKNTAKALNWYRSASGVTRAGDKIVWQSSVKKAREELTAKLQQAQQQVKVLQTQVNQVQGKRQRLQQQLQQARNNQSDATARELQTKLAGAHTQIETLQQLVARAKSEQQQVREDIEELPTGNEQQQASKVVDEQPTFRGIESAGSVELAKSVEPVKTIQPVESVQPTEVQVARTVSSEQQARDVKVGNIDFGQYYALIIGNQDYRFLPDLETPLSDARQIQQVLENKYGFTTVFIPDGSRGAILNALNDLYSVVGPNDNLVIYYAGHGALSGSTSAMEQLRRGYWLPVGARPNRQTHWISNSSISAHLDRSKARAIFVLADSCYAGAMASGDSAFLLGSAQSKLSAEAVESGLSRQARIVMSSGGVKPVVDSVNSKHSLFAEALLEVLESNKGVLRGNMLFAHVAVKVRRQAATAGINQLPQMRPIREAGHAGGDFYFVPKGAQRLVKDNQNVHNTHVANMKPIHEQEAGLQRAGLQQQQTL